MTISEGLTWQKTMKERLTHLSKMTGENAHRNRTFYGEKDVIKDPVYSVVKLDALVLRLQRAIQVLDDKIKATNQKTEIENYVPDFDVLGEIEAAAAPR